MISVTRIRDAAGLRRLSGEWNGLVDSVPESTPFQRPEWLIPWWEQFGSGELHGLVFREGERLAGVLPLFIHEWEGRRQVTLAGTGITDYLDLLAAPANGVECARLTFRYLEEHQSDWDLCDWRDLPTSSALLDGGELFTFIPEASLPCTRATLPPSAQDYESHVPHGLRRTIRIATRRLEREGELQFETLRSDHDAAVVSELFRLHESRWALNGGPDSMMDHPGAQQFLLAATRAFSAAGKLRLYTLRYRDEVAAIIYALFDRNRTWGYLTGMDPALSRFSPGSLVLGYAISDAIAEGATAWEFLRGVERYKHLWGAQCIPKVRLRIWPGRP